MTILEDNVSREVIDRSVRAGRHPGHDPARWAVPLIAEADRLAAGVWTLVAFDQREAAALWLPPHAGEPCHGDTLCLGDGASSGQTLGDAAAWLHRHGPEYAAGNPSCWARIVAARETSWGPIVVAPFVVGDRTAPPDTPRVVIDGTHRALGWALREHHLQPGAGKPSLQAYLAGPAVFEPR